MIPKIIHYCWFGKGEIPQLAKDCIELWHRYMPDYQYKLWNETNFDVNSLPYTKEAYEAKKYAFVSDYVRLWALYNEGGVYMDVDFEVYKSYDDLLGLDAFAGFEGSKYIPLMMGVCGSQPKGVWVKEQLDNYRDRHFVKDDGTYDMTTNVQFISAKMSEHGFVQNGEKQVYKDLTIFPVDYFSPLQTTGEYFRTENTYCEHRGLNSWSEGESWKMKLKGVIGQKNMTRLIKLKRKLFS